MVIFAFVVGLIFGSFANVVIYRVPLKKSIVRPPSACPFCKEQLTVRDLVPVFSWLFLRGKCRKCKVKISLRYPLIELLCGLLFAAMMHLSPTLSVIPLFVLAFVLIVVAFIDWDTQEIPDGLLIFGAVAGAAWVVLGNLSWYNALLGVAAGALPLLMIDKVALLVWKKDGFGYGDVKLMAMIGMFLGWQWTLITFALGVLICFPFAIYLMIKQCVTKDENFSGYIAFGPFLCIGALVALWLSFIMCASVLL